ncbi:4-amino-4-deoxy-L-arabinose transferase-like glycosyltransferase [Haloferula luteola]|uniref:4-amino-4-deoxy-L-arabinose transferase-like glycosyltransferase n=1 Tax=Haloferula luteola TaxID=595692 RepID=A0A840VD43_9BACT|nr:glycosyltransferase family 39 protein [Haloferula luteola]MBB5350771.1 4-amino-4-deoxy-L-arabinose transferase-like glycosyltransferase [Haloferula luteola]
MTPPHRSPSGFSLNSRQRVAVISSFGLLLLLRVLAIFAVPFTDTTEARYAEIARKMVETNNWITPQFDYGVPFWGKPPLHTWLAAAGMELFGVNEFGGRILIFFTACGLLALLHHWVKKERGRDTAWLSTTLLTGCALFFVSMATVMTDLAMLAGTALSMVGFWNALQGGKHSQRWGYGFFVGQAIGLLAKGPVAMVLTVLPLALWVLLHRRWRDTWQRLPWLSGTALMLLLTVPWYAAAEIKTPGFLRYFIIGEHFQRFLVSGWKGDLYGSGHAKPRGMIWAFWVIAMLPWTPLLLAPLARWKQVLQGFRGDAGSWRTYLLLWAVTPMIFFTLATNIIPTYVLSGVPAAVILGLEAWVLVGWHRGRAFPRAFMGTCWASLAIFTVGIVLIGAGDSTLTKGSQKLAVAWSDVPGYDFNYYGKRSFSAEFYSAGSAHQLRDFAALRSLTTNGQPDVLEIRRELLPLIPPEVLSHFEKRTEVGDDLVFIEKPEIRKEVASAH